jgi:hypothetical protein
MLAEYDGSYISSEIKQGVIDFTLELSALESENQNYLLI